MVELGLSNRSIIQTVGGWGWIRVGWVRSRGWLRT